MSKLKTNTIQHTGGSADNITLDNSQNVTVEGNLTIPDKIIHDGDTNTTIRCIVNTLKNSNQKCIYSKKQAKFEVIFLLYFFCLYFLKTFH